MFDLLAQSGNGGVLIMVAVTIQTVSGKRYSLQCTDQQQVNGVLLNRPCYQFACAVTKNPFCTLLARVHARMMLMPIDTKTHMQMGTVVQTTVSTTRFAGR